MEPTAIDTGLSLQQSMLNLGLVLFVIAILVFLLWSLNRLLRIGRIKLIAFVEKHIQAWEVKGIRFVNQSQIIQVIRSLTRVLQFGLSIVLIFAALPILFGFFPWTKPIAQELISAIVDPIRNVAMALLNYIPNFLTILVIFFFTKYLVRLIRVFTLGIAAGKIEIKGFYSDWAIPTFNIVRSLLYIFMFVVIFPYLPGSDSRVFQGVSVFLGILISFGSSSAISNMVAGVVLTYMRPFQIGDRVRILDYLGDVTQKTLLVTRLRTVKNEDITIPNSSILTSHVVNYTNNAKDGNLIVHTTITIGYDAPWRQVHDLLLVAGKATPGVVLSKEPFVLQTALNDFYVSYQINIFVDDVNLPVIYSNLHQNIQDQFNAAGLEIMSPHYSGLRDGNHIAIPKENVDANYTAPGFRIQS